MKAESVWCDRESASTRPDRVVERFVKPRGASNLERMKLDTARPRCHLHFLPALQQALNSMRIPADSHAETEGSP